MVIRVDYILIGMYRVTTTVSADYRITAASLDANTGRRIEAEND